MSLRIALAVGCLGCCINCLIVGPTTLRSALRGAGDFPGFYIGARLLPMRVQYDIDRVLQTQRKVIGVIRPKLMAVRLPFYYALLSPLARLSYLRAHAIWLVILTAAAAFATMLFPFGGRPALVAASLGSLPLLIATIRGQDIALVYLILAGGLWLRQSGRPLSAGLLLALLSIKFHLFLLLPVLFLVRREFRLLAGALVGLIALLGASFAAGGKDWPVAYVRLVTNPLVSPGPEVMPNLHGAVSRLPHSGPLEVMLSILAAGVAIAVIARSEFAISLAAALIGSFLISYHAYVQDCAVLVPALLVIFQKAASPARELALICLTPLPYVFLNIQSMGWIPGILFVSALFFLDGGIFKLSSAKPQRASR